MNLMNLQNWEPKYLLMTSNMLAGEAVSETEWNDRWNLTREQGDYNTDTLVALLNALNETAWHPTSGAGSITSPPLDGDQSERMTVAEQLDYLNDGLQYVLPVMDEDGALYIRNMHYPLYSTYPTVGEQLYALHDTVMGMPTTHVALPDRSTPNAHPISAITGLQSALDNIVAGELTAIPHNSLPDRDAIHAHPITAITDLASTITTLTAAANRSHNDWPGRSTAQAHPASAIQYDESTTVASRIANILSTIAGITGDLSELYHNDLLERDTTGAHPISAITDLQSTLNSKADAALYQRKILYGTEVPSNELGNVGDIYVRYS